MSENEKRILGQEGELSSGNVIEGIRVGFDSGEVAGVGSGGHGIGIKKGGIVVEMEVNDQVKNGTCSGFVAGSCESQTGGNYAKVVPEMEVGQAENDGEELKRGRVLQGLVVGIDSGEVKGVRGGQGIGIKKGEVVVEMEVDDQVKMGADDVLVAGGIESNIINVAGTGVGRNYDEVVPEMEVDRAEKDGHSVAVGGESMIINVAGGTGVGGNYDEVVPEMEVSLADNDGDSVAGGTINRVFQVVEDQVKIGIDGVFVGMGGESGIINVADGTGVGGNNDEVIPEMEVDRAKNGVGSGAVGTVNEVFQVVDEMYSGDISVGRNEYDSTAFEHFNSEGLNLVVDLGDLYGSGKEFMLRDMPSEELKSSGIDMSANSDKQCIDVHMEGVDLEVDLCGADKEYKDDKLAFENDGARVSVCGAVGEHFYGDGYVFKDLLYVTNAPSVDDGGNKQSDSKEIPLEMGIIANNNQNTGFKEQITGVRSEKKGGRKFNIGALRPKVRGEESQTEKEGEYYLSDLVWGKVRGHPWWPGQIFEPSAASAKADKHFKKGTYLVAYFGDRTFAWNEPGTIKPFHTHYARMAKLSNLEAFSQAVDCALQEVSRQVEHDLSCSCLPADQLAKIEYQQFINSGIQNESSRRYGICKSASSFAPTELLQNIELLAADPFHQIDKLRFVTVRAQLRAFNRWKGFDHLPDIVELDGLGDGDADFHTLEKKSSVQIHDKDEGRTRRATQDVSTLKYKHISDVGSDGSSIMVDGETELARTGIKKGSLSSKKLKANKSVSSDLTFRSQKILSHWDQKESSSRLLNYVKVGEHVCGISSQPCEPSPALEPGRKSSQSGKGNVDNNSIDAGNMPLPEEVLPKLCLVAASPMKGYGLKKSFVSFLSYYRNTICLEHKNGGKRKRSSLDQISEKSLRFEAVKMYEFEGTEDSYWTDRTIQSNPEELELLEPDNKLGIMIPNVADEVELGAENAAEGGENSEEYTPTELILKFSDLESVPSIKELNKIFSRYGPLEESRSVLFSKSKRAKVVFKRRSHAETAFSSSGKFSIFGHSLLGYCLKASTSSVRNRKVAKSASGK